MNILGGLEHIKTFILDVDGVLTDGSILVLESGEMARITNARDGYALQLAIKKGYRVFIVSGGAPSGIESRLRYLGVEEIYFGVKHKKELVQELMVKYQLDAGEVLFMGDDMPDLPVFSVVAIGACPADAAVDVKHAASYIATQPGGGGCVREVIEKVLKLNNDWKVDTEIVSA
ncbi:HAD-IIIA family hydrolase [Niabella terrae]